MLYAKDTNALSIHAPTRGATFPGQVLKYPVYLSIHAPTRGATCHTTRFLVSSSLSIHAPTRGATSIVCAVSGNPKCFQSTLLQEERQQPCIHYFSMQRFQSTLLQEERHCGEFEVLYPNILSIHAPTRGATK